MLPRPLNPVLAATALLAALLAAAPEARAGGGIETFAPGPFAVGSLDWNFGNVQVSPVTGTNPLTVQHFGTIMYPATSDGVGAPLAAGWPFPLVVFAHGRFHQAPFIGQNHKQASYLLEHLASWGFIVASVNLDVVGQFGFPAAIPQRAELIHHTLSAFLGADPGGVFLDHGMVAVLGHSRGGDGAIQAQITNPLGNPIHAVGTIAPTDFDDTFIGPVPYLGLYGSKDGDVNNGWPIWQYDKAFGQTKAFEYIHGANHFWFTDSIHYSGEGNADITREQHHDIARTYFTHFLRSAFGQNADPEFAELCDGPSLFPVTDDIEILPSYRRLGLYLVNSFQDAPVDPGHNSVGGLSLGNLLTTLNEQNLNNSAQTFYHRTSGGQLVFSNAGPPLSYYVEELPGVVDASAWEYLSLRALQRLGAAENTPNVDQDLTFVLVDEDLDLSFATLSDHGRIAYPKVHAGFQFPSKSVLHTSRVPLSTFSASNPAFDLDRTIIVALVFANTPSADLRVDDIAFTD
jgi:dienelactone hydrolase